MKLTELLEALIAHNKTNKGYQIQLNSGNLEENSKKHTDVEFGDIYFTQCKTLRNNNTLLCFDNMNRKPIGQVKDGTNLYPSEINSQMFIETERIEAIEELQNFEDWFNFPSSKVINVYMLPENDNMDGRRNVVTIGFMD